MLLFDSHHRCLSDNSATDVLRNSSPTERENDDPSDFAIDAHGEVTAPALFAHETMTAMPTDADLQQVILNLLRNGSDAMSSVDDRPRELLFRTDVEGGDRVRMRVQDAGIGFEPQSLDRLFQTFYTTKEEGMGIGLAVSHSIIENHRGRMWATPNDGPGVTFSFSIPSAVED